MFNITLAQAQEAISHPGKFEGEPLFVPILWDAVLNGASDDTHYNYDTPYAVFLINPELKEELRARLNLTLPKRVSEAYAIVLSEEDNGFIHHAVFHTIEAYEGWIDQLEAYEE